MLQQLLHFTVNELLIFCSQCNIENYDLSNWTVMVRITHQFACSMNRFWKHGKHAYGFFVNSSEVTPFFSITSEVFARSRGDGSRSNEDYANLSHICRGRDFSTRKESISISFLRIPVATCSRCEYFLRILLFKGTLLAALIRSNETGGRWLITLMPN